MKKIIGSLFLQIKKFLKPSIAVLLCAAAAGCASKPVYEPTEYTSCYDLSPQEINWGFVRKKSAPPDVSANDAALLEAYDGYYIDESHPKAIYLTFDEGYENGYTSKILDILQKKQT